LRAFAGLAHSNTHASHGTIQISTHNDCAFRTPRKPQATLLDPPCAGELHCLVLKFAMIKQYADPELYLNRELGQLEFNRRVLALAEDPHTPALERLRFLCIVDSNLDEFFEIRVAGLKAEIAAGGHPGPDGKPLAQVFREVAHQAHDLVTHQYAVLNEIVLPQLAEEGIRFLRRNKWTTAQKAWVKEYFFRELMPVLTPIGLDPAHPFPRLLNKSLNFVIELEGTDAFGRKSGMAIVQAPPRIAEGNRVAAPHFPLQVRLRIPLFNSACPCR